jgi:hypothetical protein
MATAANSVVERLIVSVVATIAIVAMISVLSASGQHAGG